MHLIELVDSSLHVLTRFLKHLLHLSGGFVLESLDVGFLKVEPFGEVSGELVEATIRFLGILANDLQLIVLLQPELSHVRFVSLSHQVGSDSKSKSSDDGLVETPVVKGVLPVKSLDLLSAFLVKSQQGNGGEESLVHESEESFANLPEGHHDFRSPMDVFVMSDHLTVLAVEMKMRTAKGAVSVVGDPIVRVLTNRVLLDRAVLELMSLVTTRGASQAKKFFGREHADLIVLDKRDLVFSFGPESLVDLVRGLLQNDVEVGFAQVDSSSIEVHHLMAGRRNDCLRVVISGVHVEHPVVLGLVPPNALLERLRISESAKVQGLVGDGPERLGREVCY